MVQRRALLEGSRLAEKLDDPEAATWYFKEASKIEKDLLRFQSIDKEVLLPTLNGENGNDFRETKLDTSILLAVLHSYNFQDRFYSASNEWILSTTSQLEAAFEKTYPINDRAVPGILIGRYPEDEYYGGNSWFLTTLAMAEIYYRAILEFIQDEKIYLVIQVNGKIRDIIRVNADISEEEAREAAIKSEKIKKYTAEKEIKKIIFVKSKLINIVV